MDNQLLRQTDMLNDNWDMQALILEAETNYPKTTEGADTYCGRGFVFFASNREAYYNLKSLNPDFAVQYIEALIDYGCEEIPFPNNALINALLCGTKQAIDKSHRAYRKKIEDSKREEYKKQVEERIKRKGARKERCK